jgi:hypothetical protein
MTTEERAYKIERSLLRSACEGYQDAKIAGKQCKNFYALINTGQLKEWCLGMAQKEEDNESAKIRK